MKNNPLCLTHCVLYELFFMNALMAGLFTSPQWSIYILDEEMGGWYERDVCVLTFFCMNESF